MFGCQGLAERRGLIEKGAGFGFVKPIDKDEDVGGAKFRLRPMNASTYLYIFIDEKGGDDDRLIESCKHRSGDAWNPVRTGSSLRCCNWIRRPEPRMAANLREEVKAGRRQDPYGKDPGARILRRRALIRHATSCDARGAKTSSQKKKE